MSQIRKIRNALGLSQAALGEQLGMSQANVSFYERGQSVPPTVAEKLIGLAAKMGVSITFDHIYRDVPIVSLAGVGAVGELNGPGKGLSGPDVAVAQQKVDTGVGPVCDGEELALAGVGVGLVGVIVGDGAAGDGGAGRAHGAEGPCVGEEMVQQ